MVSTAEAMNCTGHETLPVQDQAGNTHCYNCIIESMQTQAYNLARRMLDDWALAEDAVQESFVSGYRASHQFRGDNLKAWMMRIVANTCRDMLRSRKARPTVPLDPISSDPDDPNAPPSAADLPSTDESPEDHAVREELARTIQEDRLSEAAAARIDRRLTQCADCRQELDALRSTVSLLQRMPELTLPRSFVMPGPPPAPLAVRPPAPLRMPQWVYSGAAATAALILAILISADATGLLAPNVPARAVESTAAVQAVPESFQGDGAEAAIEMAAPLAPVAELATAEEQGLSVTTTQETEVAEAQAEAPALRLAAAAPQAAAEMAPQDDSKAAAPMAAMAEATVEEAVESKSAAPPPVAEVEEVAETQEPPTPEIAALALPDESSETAPVTHELPGDVPVSEGTNMIWRILEGLAALTALAFLVSWFLRRRTTR